MKKSIIFFLIIIPFFRFHSQQNKSIEIDLLLKKFEEATKTSDLKSLEYAQKACLIVKSIGDGEINIKFCSKMPKLLEMISETLEYKVFEESKNQNAVHPVLNEQQTLKPNEENKNQIILFSTIGLLLILSVLLYTKYRDNLKKRSLIIEENKDLLYNKNKVITEKDSPNNQSEQKLILTLEELIEEAKNNSHSFYLKFQDFYPDFQIKLLKIHPYLNSNDLKTLAYVYLDFSTKEIAQYTFRSSRTIQSRKYTLRKKLGLNSNADLGVWLRKMTS